MSELMPCPFCGSIRVSGVTLSDETRLFREFVDCEDCGASTTTYATKQEAIDAWNTRHEMTCHAVPDDEGFLNCSLCGKELDTDFDPVSKTVVAEPYCPHCGAKVVAK